MNKIKKYKNPKQLIKDNIDFINKYLLVNDVKDLFQDSILLHAVTLRIQILCKISLKYKNDLSNSYSESDFKYIKNLNHLLRDYTKRHCADLWYFISKKIPYLTDKLFYN